MFRVGAMYQADFRSRMSSYDRMRKDQEKISGLINKARLIKSAVKKSRQLHENARRSRTRSPHRSLSPRSPTRELSSTAPLRTEGFDLIDSKLFT